ncbi:MAG: hypothetical protein H6737_21795 [Alphaproteobacteria bacterium]|nr:hypothetical protein [Alphaproteobacteria bacterium]
MIPIENGIDLRRAKKLARELGIQVENVRRTGEVRFSHPDHPPVTHNNRKKVASRPLVLLLRRVQSDIEAANDNTAFDHDLDEGAA